MGFLNYNMISWAAWVHMLGLRSPDGLGLLGPVSWRILTLPGWRPVWTSSWYPLGGSNSRPRLLLRFNRVSPMPSQHQEHGLASPVWGTHIPHPSHVCSTTRVISRVEASPSFTTPFHLVLHKLAPLHSHHTLFTQPKRFTEKSSPPAPQPYVCYITNTSNFANMFTYYVITDWLIFYCCSNLYIYFLCIQWEMKNS